MKDWWIKSGCFLTGYNYSIVSSTSEVVAKTVKKYTSALIIMCILWAFIGYCFTTRYIKGNTWQAIIGALILIILVIQIERQIILALNKNKLLFIFRGTIALMMAIIGSIIIDQILFKEDIEQKKILVLQNKVNEVYGFRAAELKRQIAEIDSTIFKKESDVNVLNEDLAKNPTTKVVTTQRTNIPVPTTMLDSTGTSNIIRTLPQTSVTVTTIPNPKQELITPINDQIKYLRDQKKLKDSALLQLRANLEQDISSKVGFLDELDIMKRLLTDSSAALIVWIIWFLLLLGLELLIMFSKMGEKRNDYDATIQHQMALRLKRLELMDRTTNKY